MGVYEIKCRVYFEIHCIMNTADHGESAVIDTICVKEVEPPGEPPPRAEGKLSAIGPCGMQGRMIGF